MEDRRRGIHAFTLWRAGARGPRATREWGQPISQFRHLLNIHVHSRHHLARHVEGPLSKLPTGRSQTDVEATLVFDAARSLDQAVLL